MEKETICVRHHCEHCGKYLVERWQNWLFVVVMLIFITPMAILSVIQMRNENKKQCYTREYISGRGTNFEVLRNKDVECPK